MLARPQVEIVLSEELWRSLSHRARELGVPLELVAAGLVCDTIHPEPGDDALSPARGRPQFASPRQRRVRTESHSPMRTVRH
ncbi:hypothetical protein OJF2_79390 (plasmid) [Aquisphaera giovannonii]|uniref:Uncharacterized protein n=1 Tax=Aquisphaera giovannonii TaxID=406548 RepID=A0A5B9WGM8_9BACT|nr:hypothetical protein [Aquisphaera giovannonii]QEH39324.1 hypothetical protein OJF2_79390 [Aquisphaera giovannonii]